LSNIFSNKIVRNRRIGEKRQSIYSKPPNILVYCGRDEEKSLKTFTVLQKCLSKILDTQSQYVVYKLEHDKFLANSFCWNDNVSCLILADLSALGIDWKFIDYLKPYINSIFVLQDEHHWEKLNDFFRSGGKLVFFCENRLLANLKDCHSSKERYGLLKKAFSASNSLARNSLLHAFLSAHHSPFERDFDWFLKKISKMMASDDNASICRFSPWITEYLDTKM